jgi:hypothetical protein
MREIRTYGSVGGLGGQPPRSTRQPQAGVAAASSRLGLKPQAGEYPPFQGGPPLPHKMCGSYGLKSQTTYRRPIRD